MSPTSPPPPAKVCIVGPFRSGTNVAKAVVDSTFGISASFNSVFWKHQVPPTLPPEATAGTIFVILMKNPFHQIVSWHEYSLSKPHLQGAAAFDAFIRRPISISADRSNFPVYFFSDPVSYWNQYYFTCADLADKQPEKYILMRYEDLVFDPRRWITALGVKLNVTPDLSQAVIPGHSMRNLKGDQKFDPILHVQNIAYNASIVKNKSYMSAYTDVQKSWVAALLLPKLKAYYPGLVAGTGL